METQRGTRLVLDLTDIEHLDVRIVGGEVSVTSSSAAPGGAVRVEVDVLRGPEASVEVREGALIIEHQPVPTLGRLLAGVRGTEAVVTVVVPEETSIRVRAVNGEVFVAGTSADASVTTVSGRITATGLAGEVSLKTVSGDLDVQGAGGAVRITTVSGDLTVSGGDPDELTARAVSGDLTIDLDEAVEVDCTTVSGDVALRLPAGAGIDLDVVSVSGRIETTFPDHDLDAHRRRLRGRIGGGGRRVAVRTTSGDVTVLRRASAGAGRGRDG